MVSKIIASVVLVATCLVLASGIQDIPEGQVAVSYCSAVYNNPNNAGYTLNPSNNNRNQNNLNPNGNINNPNANNPNANRNNPNANANNPNLKANNLNGNRNNPNANNPNANNPNGNRNNPRAIPSPECYNECILYGLRVMENDEYNLDRAKEINYKRYTDQPEYANRANEIAELCYNQVTRQEYPESCTYAQEIMECNVYYSEKEDIPAPQPYPLPS